MIYLDNSATTRTLPAAAEAAQYYMSESFFNPAAAYSPAVESERAVNAARARLAGAMNAAADEIVFTSGGTESNNMAIYGSLGAMRGQGRLVVSAVEHPSVYEVMKRLSPEYDVVEAGVDQQGRVDVAGLAQLVTPGTRFVSVMQVNNETGAINDIPAIYKLVKREAPGALLHVDGVQGFLKVPFEARNCDFYTVSGHKFHGPKGVGALYVKSGVRILPHSFGGGQEKNLRPGTEGVPQICAFGEAVKHMMTEKEALTHVKAVQAHLIERLKAMPEVVLNSPENALPYIVNLSAGRVRAETMLHFLAERNIFVSSGSACGKAKPSHVLSAMQLPKERVETSLRISLSTENTAEEMDAFADALKEGLQTLSHA